MQIGSNPATSQLGLPVVSPSSSSGICSLWRQRKLNFLRHLLSLFPWSLRIRRRAAGKEHSIPRHKPVRIPTRSVLTSRLLYLALCALLGTLFFSPPAPTLPLQYPSAKDVEYAYHVSVLPVGLRSFPQQIHLLLVLRKVHRMKMVFFSHSG